jgi:hypothetical protein
MAFLRHQNRHFFPWAILMFRLVAQSGYNVWILFFKEDDLAKSHQRAPGGAPKSMTGNGSH